MNNRQLFQQHLAQTSGAPVAIEIVSASGNYLYDDKGTKYLDLIGGISVCNIGHTHPAVVTAIKEQADKYLHVMVYGELVQSPQVQYASLLAQHLPAPLSSVYFTNSGAEATEGAIKLARRATGRPHIVSCSNAYHGSTLGALSLMGDEYWRNAFRPLLPGIQQYGFNSNELIDAINNNVACVILETIQGEAGVIVPTPQWLQAVRQKCSSTGTLLILDEIQCGFGRTGKLWGFQHYGIVPDVVLLGKAIGGGMPLGAFIAGHALMHTLTHGPVLGHITTFGGHPVSCAAGMAAMSVLLNEQLIATVPGKELLFHAHLTHPSIKAVRSMGLLIAVQLHNAAHVTQTLQRCLVRGLFSDWFLFAADCIRIAPPLTITNEQIIQACTIIQDCL